MPYAPTTHDGRILFRHADLTLTIAVGGQGQSSGTSPFQRGQHRLVKACLGGEALTPKQAFTLISLQLAILSHPVIHAAANWGLVEEGEEKEQEEDKNEGMTK